MATQPTDPLAAAQALLRDLDDPTRVAKALELFVGLAGRGSAWLQTLAQSMATVGSLLQRQGELVETLKTLEQAITRTAAESASRVKECEQREALAQKRHEEANVARASEQATLERTIESIKADVTALKTERQQLREALQQARDEQGVALAALASERREAERALGQAREALTKLRATIPA